jgi:hypothetical protein
MPYTINKSNGNVQTVIADGDVDTTTSLSLLGKNFAAYGDEIATNFLHMLENFSNTSAPSNPIKGQLWYKSDTNSLRVYTGTNWQDLAKMTVSGSQPGTGTNGDLWWDNLNFQLYGYNGTGWTLVGPAAPGALGKTGQFAYSVPDYGVVPTANHTIIKEYIGGNLVAVYSKDPVAWQPNYGNVNATDMITGFSLVQPGINLATDIGNIQFNGTAANATKFGSLLTTDFLRANIAATTTGTLTVQTDAGFVVGAGNDLLLDITGGQDVRIKNQTTNGHMALSVTGTGNLSLLVGTGQILAPSGYTVTDTWSLATKSYVDSAVIAANTSVGNLVLYKDGTNYIEGNIAAANGNTNTFTLGTSSATFKNIYSTSFTGNLSGNVTGATTTLTGNLTAANVTANNAVTASTLTVNGATSVGGHINPTITGIYDIGNVGAFRNINASNVNVTTVTATTLNGTTITGASLIGSILRLSGATSGNVGLQASAVAGSAVYTLPSADGSSGQTLTTNGSGILSWTTIIGPTSNGYGTRYVSTSAPSGGSDGDVWYQVAS